ncbi:MAG: dienelactone hydrolase family protein [Alphaproteobacteria bacterium]|nr:dienelactone hydrolase family protein [Alphaproteobacteria bacterium]
MTSSDMLDGPFLPPKSGEAKQMVMFLHGYGTNGADLLSIGVDLAEVFPDTVFLSPNAPEVCEAFSAGFQWFSIRSADGTVSKEIDSEKTIHGSSGILNSFIDAQLKQWGVDESQLIVIGFSQGSMMALYTMPRRKKPCAGIISYSGMLIDGEGLLAPEIVKPPVLAVHGDADETVPPFSLKKIQDGFSAAGFNVETIMRPALGHGIDQPGLERGVQFIKKAFESKN